MSERLYSRRELFLRGGLSFAGRVAETGAIATVIGFGTMLGARIALDNRIISLRPDIYKDYGIFRPIYETSHIRGTSAEQVPDDLNVWFRELGPSFDKSPVELLRSRSAEGPTFRDGVLEKLAKNGIKIVVGDISIPDELTPFGAFWNALVEFRNVNFATKALNYAFYYNQNNPKKEKPKVGLNVGSGHDGLEDFLSQGYGYCVDVIAGYPKDFLAAFVKANGNLTDFCSVRVISLPKDFKDEDLGNPNKSRFIVNERVVDGVLLQAISNRLT